MMISIGNIMCKMLKTAFDKAMYIQPHVVMEDHWKIYRAFQTKDPVILEEAVQSSLDSWIKVYFDEKA